MRGFGVGAMVAVDVSSRCRIAVKAHMIVSIVATTIKGRSVHRGLAIAKGLR